MKRLSWILVVSLASCVVNVSPVHDAGDAGEASVDGGAVHVCSGAAQSDSPFEIAEATCVMQWQRTGVSNCTVCVQHVNPVTNTPDRYRAFVADGNCTCPPPVDDAGVASTVTSCAVRTAYALPSLAAANAVCAGAPNCLVCVESANDAGVPTLWSATVDADACTCPVH